MKAARLDGLVKALVLGLLLTAFVLAPISAVRVNADGISGGQPVTPPDDSSGVASVIGNPDEAYEPMVSLTIGLTVLRFFEL